MSVLNIAIDNGHGKEYIGKWSPVLDDSIKILDADCIDDTGRFREYLFNRKIADMLIDRFKGDSDFNLYKIVPEPNDIPLSVRKARINKINPDLSLSIHANAIGYGNTWEKANGFSVWTSRGKTRSDVYAEIMYNKFSAFYEGELKILRDYSDGDSDYEANFAMLLVKCPSILLETLFYTNKSDVQRLMDPGFQFNLTSVLQNTFYQIWNDYFNN